MNLDSSHYSGNWTNLEEDSQGKTCTKCILFHREPCIFDHKSSVVEW
jgi:hypothetical protein